MIDMVSTTTVKRLDTMSWFSPDPKIPHFWPGVNESPLHLRNKVLRNKNHPESAI